VAFLQGRALIRFLMMGFMGSVGMSGVFDLREEMRWGREDEILIIIFDFGSDWIGRWFFI
jgi:hypothetical protein